ncbi:MAG TPA: cation:proton antiporter [Myxococcales bacterium]|nr:cation:proton antiporter [Myxococcales bacterium]
MEHDNAFLTNLAVVLCVAAATTVLFQRLRQPVVLGYLIAGLIVGPYVPVPLVADREIVHQLSELGVVLLLFSIGLEFTFGKLARVGGTAGLVAVVQVSVMMVLGGLTGRTLGWTSREALYAGAIVAISSTTIIAKAFEENRIGGRLRELVLSVLVVEDLVAILLLAGLTALSSGKLSAAALAATAGRLLLFLVVVVAAGMVLVPRFVRSTLKLGRPETTVVACVGICFAISLLAQRLGYSVALGAFLAGSLVAESGQGEALEHLLQPVRDLFAAVFFVSVGMLIDPALVARHWVAVVVLSAVVIGGKIAGVALPALLAGSGVRTAVQAGMSMAQIGEFSFIIAGLGIALGAAGDFIYPVAVAVSALTTLTTPWLIRWSGPAAAWVDAKLPRSLQTLLALEGAWTERLREPAQRTGRVRRLAGLLLLDTFLLAVLVIAEARFFDRGVELLAPRIGLRWAQVAAVAVGALLGSPFVLGIVRLVGGLGATLAAQALPQAGGGIDLAAAPRRAFVVSLQLAAAIVLGLPLVAVTQLFLPRYVAALAFAVVLILLAVRLWRSAEQLQGHVRAGAEVLVEALASQARPDGSPPSGQPALSALFPGLGSPVPVVIAKGTAAVGKTLAGINLRGRTGATVLAIRRGQEGLLVPTGRELLQADDVLALAGTHESVDAARDLLSQAKVDPPPNPKRCPRGGR